jgi:hypothetical protein
MVGNYIAGVACGTCIRAGYADSPAYLEFTGNRSVHNRDAGLLLNGATFGIPERGDQLDVVVQGNDLSENTSMLGVGLRVYVIRRDLPDRQSSGSVHALIRGNRLFGNQIGISLDAGFPYRQTHIPPPNGPLVCDTRPVGTMGTIFCVVVSRIRRRECVPYVGAVLTQPTRVSQSTLADSPPHLSEALLFLLITEVHN